MGIMQTQLWDLYFFVVSPPHKTRCIFYKHTGIWFNDRIGREVLGNFSNYKLHVITAAIKCK